MQHTLTLPAGLSAIADTNLSGELELDPSNTAYLSVLDGDGVPQPVLDSDGNKVIAKLDKSTGEYFARVATYNPNDGSADAVAISNQSAIPNFKGASETHGYWVPVFGLIGENAGGIKVGNSTGAVLAQHVGFINAAAAAELVGHVGLVVGANDGAGEIAGAPPAQMV